MGGLATSLVGKGHSPQFCKGHQDTCGVWGVLEDKCQAGSVLTEDAGSSAPDGGSFLCGFSETDMSEDFRDLLFGMPGYFLRIPRNK